MSVWSVIRGAAAVLGLVLAAGCAGGLNEPVNRLAEGFVDEAALTTIPAASPDAADRTMVALAFSGGGTRAAAFSFGLLQELRATPLPGEPGRSMLDAVRFVSGVSGGSVTAAYYGLKGEDALADFRERFLLQDAEASMRTAVLRPTNLLRVASGGVNDRTGFARWLDRNLFDGARFSGLAKSRVRTWINATDIYNRTPFIFEPTTFAALCSDLGDLPLSEAVAASAAVPIVFAPIVLESYGRRCGGREPGWLVAARNDPNATAALRSYARALATYRDADRVRYVKLLDGGISDNFGVTGFTIARAAAATPYAPLSPEEAVRLDRVVYFVANAGRGERGDWSSTREGPGGVDLLMAVTDTAIDGAAQDGFDAFRLTMQRWHDDLIAWRCALKPADVKRLRGSAAGWNCRDLKLFVGEIRFDQLDPVTAEKLDRVPTRLVLPAEDVDLTIASARSALRRHPVFNGLLRSLEGADPAGRVRAAAASPGASRLTPD